MRKLLCAGLLSLFCLGGVPSAEATAFQIGDQGNDVAEIQTALIRLGYDVVPDGSFGPGTAAAVRAFEISRGMDPDGLVGPVVYEALLGRAIPDTVLGGDAMLRRIPGMAL